ncbi:MAG: hypothetical protein ACREK5_02320 [Gemmatimonadota bacterium]
MISGKLLRTAGFLAFLAFAVVGTATVSLWGGGFDYWQHLSAVRTLSSSLLHPPPLYFSEPYEIHLYTPYHVFWAIVLRVFGPSIWDVAILMTAVNAGIFALGARLLARHLFKDPELDFAMLATLLVFWGQPVEWSGVYSLGQLSFNGMYPSFFALAASMIVGALWLEDGYRTIAAWAGLTLGIAVIVATHAITASFLLMFLFFKTLVLRPPARRELLSSGLCVLAGCTLGLLWPYYSLMTLVNETRSGPDVFGYFTAFYEEFPRRLGLEVLGVLALPLAKPGRTRNFLGILLLVSVGIFVGNYVLHLSHVLSRYLIFSTFVLQLSVAAAVSVARGRSLGGIVLPAFVLLVGLGALRQVKIATASHYGLARDLAAGMALGTHSAENQSGELERLDELDGDGGQVMMAPLDWAYRVTALSGFRVVGVMNKAPTMPDYEGRLRDVGSFYDPETPAAARQEIIERRDVAFVLIPLDGGPDQGIVSPSWKPVLRTSTFIVHSTR